MAISLQAGKQRHGSLEPSFVSTSQLLFLPFFHSLSSPLAYDEHTFKRILQFGVAPPFLLLGRPHVDKLKHYILT